MTPSDLAEAAAALSGQVPTPAATRLLGVLGDGSGATAPPRLLVWLQIGARMDRVFLLSPPLAPGAVLCGATFRPDLAGPPVHLAGFGPTPHHAFVRAMAEAAEAAALATARRAGTRTLPALDADLRPAGDLAAAPVLADGAGMAAGATLSHAARAAVLEALERHALALWVSGQAMALRLAVPPAVRQLEAGFRAGQAAKCPPLRFVHLPALPGATVVAAISEACADGPVVGYGCDPDPMAACCKAATEAAMAEAGHMLAARARDEGTAPPPLGALARAAWFGTRPDLIHPRAAADWPQAGSDRLAELAKQAGVTVRLADLGLTDEAIPVLKAAMSGLHRLADHVPPGCPGPL